MESNIYGLDLLQNPHKYSKKTEKKEPPKKIIAPKKPLNDLDSFKIIMNKYIEHFKLPLENFQKNDPIMIQLECCYYFYKKRK